MPTTPEDVGRWTLLPHLRSCPSAEFAGTNAGLNFSYFGECRVQEKEVWDWERAPTQAYFAQESREQIWYKAKCEAFGRPRFKLGMGMWE